MAASRFGLRDWSLACASGALLTLSFPKFDVSLLAWVALVPLLVAIDGKKPGQAFLLAHVTGIGYFAGVFYWIGIVHPWNLLDSMITQGVYLPLFVSLWACALNWLRQRTGLSVALIAPSLWVTSEYVRGHASFLSLPWMFLGHSQHMHPLLIQIAALTGVYGLSFLIVLANAVIAEAVTSWRGAMANPAVPSLSRSQCASLGITALLVAASLLYGASVLNAEKLTERMPIAIVQGNIPQGRTWDESSRKTILDRYARLTRDAAKRAPTLVVWPESAVPGDAEHHPELRQAVAQLAVETHSYLLVGSSESAKFTSPQLRGKQYNSMVLFSPEGELQGVYRKIALVPFGEYVPLRDIVTWPKAIVAEMGDYLAGDEFTAFRVGPAIARALICWEIIFPDLVREAVREDTDFLVLASNEAWFGDTAAPYQLLAMTVFRAAENRVAIARAANSGVSALIDPFGRIRQRLTGANQRDLFVQGVLTSEVPLYRGATLYTRYGDVFAFLQIAFAGILALGPRKMAGMHRLELLGAPRRRPVASSPTKGGSQ